MLPIKIEMQAFGCYSGNEVVDFRVLGKSALFLIHGPTGSGKTTVLDAMSFALFGEANGLEREPKEMRSHFADAGLPTKVVFEFELGERRFRVERQPEQVIRKKRSEGSVSAKATLWELTNSETGEPLCTKAREVTEKVEELLGCGARQFRQLIIIPQGEFRKLLSADVRERKEILKTLFRTEYYAHIEKALSEAAIKCQRALDEVLLKSRSILEQQGVKTVEELKARIESGNTERLNLLAGNTALKGLLADAQEKLKAAVSIEDKFKEFEQSIDSEKQVALEKDLILEKKRLLTAGKNALPLQDNWSVIEDIRAELVRHEEAVKKTRGDFQGAEAVHKAAVKKLGDESDREKSLQTKRGTFDTQNALLPKVKRLAEKRSALCEALEEKETAKGELDELVRTDKEARERLSALSKLLEAAAEEAGAKDKLTFQIKDIEGALLKLKTLAEVKGLIKVKALAVKLAEKALEEKEAALNARESELDKAKERQCSAQAAVLAAKLKKGEACPVCGSTNHPAPAHGGEKAVSDDEIKQLEERVKELKKEVADCRKNQGARDKELSTEKGREAAIVKDLGKTADESAGELKTRLAAAQKELDQALAAEDRKKRVPGRKETA